ncbi:NADH dehydrogenase (ubiquinone) 1 beta subcomplex [Chamberlinius hualienensis]
MGGGEHGHSHGHGDGHGHGHEKPYEIPDWKIYKVEDVPQLVTLQNLLAQKGLKDPWLRNEVWRYHKNFGTIPQRIRKTFFTGFGVGFAAFLATIAFEKLTQKDDEHGHADHHGH